MATIHICDICEQRIDETGYVLICVAEVESNGDTVYPNSNDRHEYCHKCFEKITDAIISLGMNGTGDRK